MSRKEVPELVARIRTAMAFADMSLKALAERVGIPYRTLQKYVLGTHRLPVAALPEIAKALDVSTDWLLTGMPARLHLPSLEAALAITWFTNPHIADPKDEGRHKEDVRGLELNFIVQYNMEYLRRFNLVADAPRLTKELLLND